jgi:hypothetical protein
VPLSRRRSKPSTASRFLQKRCAAGSTRWTRYGNGPSSWPKMMPPGSSGERACGFITPTCKRMQSWSLPINSLFTSGRRSGQFDLPLAPWPGEPARALGVAPPARPGHGKTPEDGLICIEQNDFTTAGPGLQGSEVERRSGSLSEIGSEPARGAAVADVFFF